MEDHEARQVVFTVNQLVAINLVVARSRLGWKQAQAIDALEPFLGTRWSKASYSAAERSSVNPQRIRKFTADEIVAFAAAFDVPVQFFFQPPRPEGAAEVVVTASATAKSTALTLVDYLRIMLGSEQSARSLEGSLADILAALPASADDAVVADLRRALRSATAARMRASKQQFEAWEDALSGIQELLRAAIVDGLGDELGRKVYSFSLEGEERSIESMIDDEDSAADEEPE